jgi:alpha-galactosidase/6-phospho-beta-glucosidase family protein
MNITITKVLKNEVTVSGQTLAREYVENVMLPLLMAQCGRNNGSKFAVIKAFDEAGVSLKAIPEDAQTYFLTKRDEQAKREREQREADAHAELLREWSPRELAQAKDKKEARAAAIREQSAKVLAARRNSGW